MAFVYNLHLSTGVELISEAYRYMVSANETIFIRNSAKFAL